MIDVDAYVECCQMVTASKHDRNKETSNTLREVDVGKNTVPVQHHYSGYPGLRAPRD